MFDIIFAIDESNIQFVSIDTFLKFKNFQTNNFFANAKFLAIMIIIMLSTIILLILQLNFLFQKFVFETQNDLLVFDDLNFQFQHAQNKNRSLFLHCIIKENANVVKFLFDCILQIDIICVKLIIDIELIINVKLNFNIMLNIDFMLNVVKRQNVKLINVRKKNC